MEYKKNIIFSKKENIKIILLFALGYSLLKLSSFVLNNGNLFDLNDETMMIVNTILTVGFVFTATLLIGITAKKQMINHIYAFGSSLKKDMIIVFLGVISMYFTVIGFEWIVSTFSYYEAPVVEAVSIPIAYQLIALLTLVLLTPIMEETVFRGVAIPLLERKTSWIISVLILNGFFAVMHIYSIGFLFFPMYLLLGLILSLAYKFSDDNLVVTIMIHMLFNLLMVV